MPEATTAAGPALEPPGVCADIVRIAGRRRTVEIGELGGVRLAEHDGARGFEQRHDMSIDRARRNLRAGLAAGAGRQAGDVEHVLDGDRYAVKRTANAAGFRLLPQELRLGERPLAIEQAPAAHLLLDGFDAPRASFDKRDRVGLSALDGGARSPRSRPDRQRGFVRSRRFVRVAAPGRLDIGEHFVQADHVGVTTPDVAQIVAMRAFLHVAAARLRHDDAEAI